MDRLRREKKERLQQLKKETQSTGDRKTEQPSTFDILATTMSGSASPNSSSPTGHSNAVTDTINNLPTDNTSSAATVQRLVVNSSTSHMPSPESINGDTHALNRSRSTTVGSDIIQNSRHSDKEHSDLPVASAGDFKVASDNRRMSNSEEEEVDEFGRVRTRRQHYVNRSSSNHGNDSDECDSESHHRRRRRSSSSDRGRRSTRSNRRRTSRSRSPRDRLRSRSRSGTRHRDPYTAAARYIDTEFFPTKIYIGDLVGLDKYQLEDAFSPYGQIEDIKTVAGKDFAFITYDHPESALYAIKRMDGVRLGKYRIKVNRAKIPERNRVGFGNVPWKDEDGVVAEEDNMAGRQPKQADPTQPLDPRAMGGGRQVLSYDDL
ncbi:hypothetical protein INT43_002610 [Umbelopsis isabellina]|uniref:RRM domain-containing protein n=1 Tax=Mortierella isabellina TaxID=91625 RepID=A0A8H7ULH8_MORIS|nr:hypothetical protein INT43_002610 [Umbelopsis isabellina]